MFGFGVARAADPPQRGDQPDVPDRVRELRPPRGLVLPDSERTWTVVDDGHVVAPAEEFLEFMRATG